MTPTDEKSALRKRMQAVRRDAVAIPGLGGQLAARAAEILPDLARGRMLAGYMPMRGEADPLPAMAAHRGGVCVPVIVARGAPLAFRAWTPDAAMVAGDFGALVPAEGAWCVPEVLIVPLLAFDGRGMRLGYGGGFYDRTLAGLRAGGAVLAVGLAFGAQEVPEVPTEPTDAPLDAVLTEAGLRRFGV
jgi:5-formyltetrahydrofolate cyclo-ligase